MHQENYFSTNRNICLLLTAGCVSQFSFQSKTVASNILYIYIRWPKSTSNLLDLLGTSLAGTLGISRGFSYPYALKYNSALYVWVRFDWLKNLLYVTNNYFRKWRLVRFLSQESGSLVNP